MANTTSELEEFQERLQNYGISKDFHVVFGKTVKEFRSRKKLSQKELARQMACSENTIRNIEKGRKQVSLPELLLLSVTLDASIEELLIDVIEVRRRSEESTTATGKYMRSLSPEQLDRFLKIMRTVNTDIEKFSSRRK